MRASRILTALMVCAAVLSITGCGRSSKASRQPTVAGVPLTPGAKIVDQVSSCDRGANPYCSLQLVVVDSRFRNSTQLLDSETKHLYSLGWTETGGDTGQEKAVDSPGNKLRLTYAIASDDLKALDLGWIHRRRPIAKALSGVMFGRAPALSIMLESGSA